MWSSPPSPPAPSVPIQATGTEGPLGPQGPAGSTPGGSSPPSRPASATPQSTAPPSPRNQTGSGSGTSNRSGSPTVPSGDPAQPDAIIRRGSALGPEGSTPPQNSFEIAKAGGKHSGFLKNYQGKPVSEIRKGIASIEKQIAEHQDKMAYPEKYYPDWSKLDPREQQALITKKWPLDIQRQTEQLEILQELLKANP